MAFLSAISGFRFIPSSRLIVPIEFSKVLGSDGVPEIMQKWVRSGFVILTWHLPVDWTEKPSATKSLAMFTISFLLAILCSPNLMMYSS